MCESALSSYRSAFLFPVLPFTLFVPRCALLLLPLSQSKAPSVQPLFLVLLRLWSPGRRRQRHHRRPHAVCAPSFIDLLTLGLVKRIYQRKKRYCPFPICCLCSSIPPPQSVLWIALFILIEGSASAATVPGAGLVVLAGPASATPPPPLALRQLRLSVHRSG